MTSKEDSTKKNVGESESELKQGLRYLTINGTRYRTGYTYKFENRPVWENPDKTKLVSYIP